MKAGSKMGLSNWNIFNRHKKIERFLVGFFCITVPLILMTFVSIYNKFGLDQESLSANALYTSTVTLSRTNQTGKVAGVFVNKAKTRGMVLIRMNDAGKISSKAEDYKTFTTAVDLNKRKEPLESMPTGSIYIFGSSGYIGLYFVDNAGFKSQIFKTTVRLDKEFVNVDEKNIKDEVAGTTYAKHDQMDLYFNLGAKKAKTLKALDKNNISVQDLYVEAIGSGIDMEKREVLTADLKHLSKLKLQIEEQHDRLEQIAIDGVGLVVPDLPKEMKSDSFSGDGDKIVMSTDYVYNGGIDFNWQKAKFEDGYFNEVNNETTNPDKLSLARWLVKLKNDQAADRGVTRYEHDWVMSDGTAMNQFINDLGLDNAAVKDMQKQVQNYMTLVSEYLESKQTYQTQNLRQLVALDIALENATSSVDSISEEHFFTY